MSILGIDIGTSTTKIIEYKDGNILNKKIYENIKNSSYENFMRDFIINNNTEKIERIVFTGIGAEKINKNNYSIPVDVIDEFLAIAKGGLVLANKQQAIVASIGTGTAFIRATQDSVKHLGGSGVGAGTLTNICNQFVGTKNFKEILEISKNGDLSKIDLRIGDIIQKEITTLPQDLTLANFGKISNDVSKADIILGVVNMIFETIGMMAAFITINDYIKDVVLIGNISTIPAVKEILKKIENTHKINFIIPQNSEFGVALGAIDIVRENN